MRPVMTVYRWELRKLRAQKRTYLGLGAAAAVPIIFVVALVTGGGRPNERREEGGRSALHRREPSGAATCVQHPSSPS